ncbi:MAG: hypothetical protein DRG31_01345 [Deltaproteobacteria bacterium]|nr:MAG: hypothetical protein DRG31_01345 [Deltaproteobacteria bacterium]
MPSLRPTVLITRPKGQGSELRGLLEGKGFRVLWFPTIEIVPPRDFSAIDRAIMEMESYEWIVFTSANGVEAFLRRWELIRGKDKLPPLKVGAIGPGTARALKERGIGADLVPQSYRSEDLARELVRKNIRGKRILLPRAEGARKAMVEILRGAGAVVTEVPVYTIRRPENAPDLKRLLKGVDMVIFTSGLAVHNFMEMIDHRWPKGVEAAVIGPVTAEVLKGYGIRPKVMPKTYTLEALAWAIIDYFGGEGRCASPQPTS